MSCKNIKQLIAESIDRNLTEQEKSEIEIHSENCPLCFEQMKRENLLSQLFSVSTEIDDSYIIPQNIMKNRVEQQLKDSNTSRPFVNLIKKPILIPLFSAALILFAITFFFTEEKNNNLFAYEVSLDGIALEMVDDNDLICEMLYTIGLTEASFDVIGCDTTCALVIFDLKSKQEAEMVVNIFHAIDKQTIKTDVIEIEQNDVQTL